ncbi:MAG: response regulator [Myxococcota bacterium]
MRLDSDEVVLTPPGGRSRRVVMLDDDPTQLRIHTRVVQRLAPGVNLTSFTDPAQAVDAVLEEPPRLVITDFNMPSLDGIAVCERLRAVAATVVLVSGELNLELRLAAKAAGAAACFPKPFDIIEIFSFFGVLGPRSEPIGVSLSFQREVGAH